MPQQTKSSFSTKARISKAKQVTVAASGKNGFKCDINGCTATFRNQTDVSRHRWVHLPVHLRPTCPFEGAYGYRCSEPYTGRAEHIKLHWSRDHPEAGPYPGNRWPKLNEILAKNQVKLGVNSPRTFTPRTSHSPSLEHVSDGPSLANAYSNGPCSFDQHGNPLAQRDNPQLVPFHADPQGISQTTPNFNFPAAFHRYDQYMTSPVNPTFVNGAYLTSGQYVPNSFETQVEDMEFDMSLAEFQAYMTEKRWNEFIKEYIGEEYVGEEL